MIAQDSSHPTGVSDTTAGGSHVVRARDRKANAAIQLRRAGASWDEVAEVIGYPTARMALVAVEKALEKELKTQESQSFMRQLAGQRLDRLLRGVWPKAINADHPEHLLALDRAQRIISQHSKLYGLDAPAEMIVHSPTQNELERWVATVVQSTVPELEEFDIFDAVLVEGSVEQSSLSEPEEDPHAVPD